MKTVIVFDHDDGTLQIQPLPPGSFYLLTEAPLTLDQRTDSADGSITLKLKAVIVPPSLEGQEFLQE